MTVLKPRSRMISVRLSEDEYCALQEMCTATGARSVSDLTRDAMHELLNGTYRVGGLGAGAGDFRSQIKDLERRIEQLATDVTTLKANGSSTGGDQ